MGRQMTCSEDTCNCDTVSVEDYFGYRKTTTHEYPIGSKIILIIKDKIQPVQDTPKLSFWKRLHSIDSDCIKKKVALRIYTGILSRVDEERKMVYMEVTLATPGFDSVTVPFELKDIIYIGKADESAYAIEIEV